jgi:hypothetical protein
MRREHDLTAAEAELFSAARAREEELRAEYFGWMGRAKEAETQLAALTASREQQLAIIVRNAALPPGRVSFSPDGLRLLIEPVETAAAMLQPESSLAATLQPAAVNGVANHGG